MYRTRRLNIHPVSFGSLGASRRGAVAVLFALTMVPLVIGAGMATDFARAQILKSSLQTIADSSALAGASELNQNQDPNISHNSAISIATSYFNKGSATLMDNDAIGTPTVTAPDSITVQVSVTATLKTTLMSLLTATVPMSVSATAKGPGYAIKATKTGGFSSTAYDGDDVYFYVVRADGTVSYTDSDYTLLYASNSTAANPNVAVGANDKVGFALYNTTGRKTPYTQGYGSKTGQVHKFYSSLPVPSMDSKWGYPPPQATYHTGTMTTDRHGTTCVQSPITINTTDYLANPPTGPAPCYPHPCVTLNGSNSLQNNLLVGSGSGTDPGSLTNPACSTPATAVKTCLDLYNNPTTFAWSDMGGGQDVFRYNNAVYTISCQPNTTGIGSAGQPGAVILVK